MVIFRQDGLHNRQASSASAADAITSGRKWFKNESLFRRARWKRRRFTKQSVLDRESIGQAPSRAAWEKDKGVEMR
jgi:hypothetical protein